MQPSLSQSALGLAINAPLARPTDPTFAGRSFVSLHDRVAFVERVALIAMGLAGIPRTRANAAQRIRAHRHRFKMARVETRLVAAEMIDHEAGRDRADQPLVCDPMNTAQAEVGVPDAAVSGGKNEAGPVPTLVRAFVRDGRQSFLEREPVLVWGALSHMSNLTWSAA